MPKECAIGNLPAISPNYSKRELDYKLHVCRGIHATQRDATVRGPRSPADRGAALERPILLEVSSKSRTSETSGP